MSSTAVRALVSLTPRGLHAMALSAAAPAFNPNRNPLKLLNIQFAPPHAEGERESPGPL
jgi:hypothetical protein